MTDDQRAPHENETMHDPDAVTEPERTPAEGRFDIGEGVSGVAETDAEPAADAAAEPDPSAEQASPGYGDARRSIAGTGEDRDA
ncbi:hypothetical protein OVN18_10815 [Microcella daejeonensis]|uniref:Uncharacterized protein n=1 Tax=Microcella daejeonensis TaxID=2994971 RepID=A0A9E8MK44_9MICO|nr:hypothetical protein [Microcella daejeonensis]WAB81039.1 hypothetical protein OVN18_10815 [Microcella daejeonensis]WAB83210.1 hypothetical protein OVN20_08930 [Microcella daejeonensis]